MPQHPGGDGRRERRVPAGGASPGLRSLQPSASHTLTASFLAGLRQRHLLHRGRHGQRLLHGGGHAVCHQVALGTGGWGARGAGSGPVSPWPPLLEAVPRLREEERQAGAGGAERDVAGPPVSRERARRRGVPVEGQGGREQGPAEAWWLQFWGGNWQCLRLSPRMWVQTPLGSPASHSPRPHEDPQGGEGVGTPHCLLTWFCAPSSFVFLLDHGLDLFVWRGSRATLSSTTKAR